MSLTPTECAYIAGIIDGEGSLTIHKQRTGGKGYVAKLDMGNTHKGVVTYLQNLFPGTVKKYIKESPYKDVWYWRIHASKIRELLPQIYPYLIIKKKLAKLYLEYLNLTKPGNFASNQNPKRGEIIGKIKKLTKKGKS